MPSDPADLVKQCRICGVFIGTGLIGMPEPLLPGDIPKRDELCDWCAATTGDEK